MNPVAIAEKEGRLKIEDGVVKYTPSEAYAEHVKKIGQPFERKAKITDPGWDGVFRRLEKIEKVLATGFRLMRIRDKQYISRF